MSSYSDDNARPRLTDLNTEKAQRIAQRLNMSVTQLTNYLYDKLVEDDIEHIVTFNVEVRDQGKEHLPGRQRKVRMRLR